MQGGDIARYQIEDRIRAAEQDRTARMARDAQRGGRRRTSRRMRSGLLAVAGSLRLRHATGDVAIAKHR
jgi:hypothetical protein